MQTQPSQHYPERSPEGSMQQLTPQESLRERAQQLAVEHPEYADHIADITGYIEETSVAIGQATENLARPPAERTTNTELETAPYDVLYVTKTRYAYRISTTITQQLGQKYNLPKNDREMPDDELRARLADELFNGEKRENAHDRYVRFSANVRSIVDDQVGSASEKFRATQTEKSEALETPTEPLVAAVTDEFLMSERGGKALDTIEQAFRKPVVQASGRLAARLALGNKKNATDGYPSEQERVVAIEHAFTDVIQGLDALQKRPDSFVINSKAMRAYRAEHSFLTGFERDKIERQIQEDALNFFENKCKLDDLEALVDERLKGEFAQGDPSGDSRQEEQKTTFDAAVVASVDAEAASLKESGKSDKEVYRTLSKKYHIDSDSGIDPRAEEAMRYINTNLQA